MVCGNQVSLVGASNQNRSVNRASKGSPSCVSHPSRLCSREVLLKGVGHKRGTAPVDTMRERGSGVKCTAQAEATKDEGIGLNGTALAASVSCAACVNVGLRILCQADGREDVTIKRTAHGRLKIV